MLKLKKFTKITTFAGIVLGIGVVIWLQLFTSKTEEVTSHGGTVALLRPDASSLPASMSAGNPNAAQSTPSEIKAKSGLAGPEALKQSNSHSNNIQTNLGPESLPGPTEFKQYEQYKSKTTALFEDIKLGGGLPVVSGSKLAVLYQGWLTDGTLFDSRITAEKPFEFVEGDHRVIVGWEEALAGMKVGGKRRLILPPSTAYGSQTAGSIPANSVLIFDVELLAIQ